MSNFTDDYVLCNDERSLGDAIEAIKLCSQVIFDCEGQDLGQDVGSLSLINFRTIGPEISKTYLIDVLSLTNDILRPVFDIIQSPSPTKIIFDGRMDYAELFHGYNVSIRGVLDLQLADIYSRRLRGEDDEEQERRLSPYLKRTEVVANSRCYTQVQKLCGLEQCLREHEIDGGKQEDKIQGQKDLSTRPLVNHYSWLKRPLPEEYLRYAAWDVYFIGLLYDHFKGNGYITDALPAQSEHYATIWKDAKPKKGDPYRNHGLLPLQILEYSTINYAFRSCICCQRSLPNSAYSANAWGKPKQRRCWVCRAIYLKEMRTRSSSNYDSEDRYDYYDSDGFGSDYHGYSS